MTPERQRIAIAEWCGWKEAFPRGKEPHPETKRSGILLPYEWVNEVTHERSMNPPDYLNDLNAMHEAEKKLDIASQTQLPQYAKNLWLAMQASEEAFWGTLHATAAQRAEALLRTISKWED